MGKKAPSAPPAPDPVATSQAQAQANAETARLQAQLNRVNQYGPYTNITYTNQGKEWIEEELAKRRQEYDANPGRWVEGGPTAIRGLGSGQPEGYWQDPGGETGARTWIPLTPAAALAPGRVWQANAPFDEEAVRAELAGLNPYADQWSQHTTFTPEGQAAFDREVALNTELDNLALSQTRRIGGVLSEPLNLDGLPVAPDLTTGALERQRVEQALLERLRPQQQQDRSALETQLLNSGFSRGTSGWDRASAELGQRENDARLSAILAGGDEQSRMFGLAQTARDRALQERLLTRNQPINEITALMSGGQVSIPQFSPVPQTGVSPTDVQGAYDRQYQGQLAQYQAQNQRSSGMMGGLFGLGGAALGGWAQGGFK